MSDGPAETPSVQRRRDDSARIRRLEDRIQVLSGTIAIATDHGTRCTLRFSERVEDD